MQKHDSSRANFDRLAVAMAKRLGIADHLALLAPTQRASAIKQLGLKEHQEAQDGAKQLWKDDPDITIDMPENPVKSKKPCFKNKFEALLKARAYNFNHTEISLKSKRGEPDYRIWHEYRKIRTFYVELKSKRRPEPEPDQAECIRSLREAGDNVYVWRPEHWHELIDILW